MDKGWGEEGEGGLSGESSTEAYTLTYVKQPMGICWMTQGTQTGLLEQPRGVGKGGRWQGGSRARGTYEHMWLIHVDVWQKSNQYSKAIILQLKINEF